jgi:hypothetical protein
MHARARSSRLAAAPHFGSVLAVLEAGGEGPARRGGGIQVKGYHAGRFVGRMGPTER